MSEKNRDRRNHLSFSQRVAIMNALVAVCRKVGEYAVYEAGHDDRTVAAGMDFPCTEHNVASLRKSEIGPMKIYAPVPVDAMSDRLARLEKIVAALCADLRVDPEAWIKAA